MPRIPPPDLKLVSENENIPKRIKQRRVPNTWKYIKTERGPDKTQWAGDGFTLKSRAKAAQQDWPANFKMFQPEIKTLGMRHQKLQKYVTKVLIDRDDLRIRLFMGGSKNYFLREVFNGETKEVAESICYPDPHRALREYRDNHVCYEPSITLPNS